MDGAIILSKDLKRILFANTQLNPNANIVSRETGTRHRTAERTSKQTQELVISISQRRNIITVFKGDFRYVIEETASLLAKANQALQTVEKYKKVLDSKLSILNEYEFNDIVTLDNVITVIQRVEMVMRMAEEVQRNIDELGVEGRLLQMQLDELVGDLEEEELFIVKDYMVPAQNRNAEKILNKIIDLPYEDLMNSQKIAKILGYEISDSYDEVGLNPKGYRVLNKIPKMPANVVENLVKKFKSLQYIITADIPTLDEVEGIGEVRAKSIKQGLKRMQEQFVFDNIMV
jgi:diadenylate cyclase